MRRKIVAGNWKMNLTFQDADELIQDIADELEEQPLKDTVLIVCPPMVYLELGTDYAEESPLRVGSQNVSDKESGAYTGEVSAPMLQSMNVDYCIVGHSERRMIFGEDDTLIAQKVSTCIDFDVDPIFCCGERLSQRESGDHFEVIRQQINNGLFALSDEQIKRVVIAYEPVWAIGTGRTASPEQAQEMHHFIRQVMAEQYGEEIADEITLLYGGSCKPSNAKELFAQPDVDGGLIGGASLNADDFMEIARSF